MKNNFRRRYDAKIFVFLFTCLSVPLQAQNTFPQIEPIDYQNVNITDAFWAPRLSKLATVTIPVCVEQTEIKTPRIRNFEKVPGKSGKHEGIYYDDSDVYKALEAMAYSLKNHPDAALEKKADEWIDKIAAAQQPDGYLNTYFSLGDLSKRWTDMEKHEDYCAGHLIEAAVAYYNVTGKRKLLDVAIRLANHIDDYFRKQQKHWVSGHQEIELALVKLFRVTKDRRYLELSDWFLQQRGKGFGKGVIWDQWKAPEYCQDKVPVKDQTEITGHAVRAMYMYSGAADVASSMNDTAYMKAMKTVWEDVVYRNMYLTGGIGSSGSNEGFSTDYDLPNEEAYCETCASVGMVLWNLRMNLLTGDSKYIDVLERSLYNGALDGLSLSGDRFFYGNPLASEGNYGRSEWFGTACCPSNISRLIASIGGYVYATSKNSTWINLFIGSNTTVTTGKSKIQIEQLTDYPWDGLVTVRVTPDRKTRHTLRLRIPDWAVGHPVPGDTYRYLDTLADKSRFTLTVNKKSVSYKMENGYAVIDREWKRGDQIELNLPMNPRRVVSTDRVSANRNKVAIERGPLVYCLEHVDNNGHVYNIMLPDKAELRASVEQTVLGKIVSIEADADVAVVAGDGSSVSTETRKMKAIPYYAWANRGMGEMQVWIPRKASVVFLK